MSEYRPHLTSNNLDDYRNAPSGEGPLAAEWKDKPHWLIYDLAAQIEGLREDIAQLRDLLAVVEWSGDARAGYPCCPVCRGFEPQSRTLKAHADLYRHKAACALRAALDGK